MADTFRVQFCGTTAIIKAGKLRDVKKIVRRTWPESYANHSNARIKVKHVILPKKKTKGT